MKQVQKMRRFPYLYEIKFTSGMIKMSEEKKIIKFKPRKTYEKDESFKSYYANGALGGFRNPYDFRLAFYKIGTTEFLMETQSIKTSEGFKDEEKDEKVRNTEMRHKILCELVMTERAVRELHNFLGRELKLLDQIKEQGGMKDLEKANSLQSFSK